jgi:hypothetical protein
MINKIEQYKIIIIAIFLVLSSVIFESPFHGYFPPLMLIFLLTVSFLLFYLFSTDKFILAEKIVYSFLVSIIALFGGVVITELILGAIYGYDTNFYDELKSPPILENLLFYFSTNFIGIGIFKIWMKYKNRFIHELK